VAALVVPRIQVSLLERIDRALGAAVARLRADAKAGGYAVSVCVCGDHSSPVLYGDHSHEPVPFLLCPLEHLTADAATAVSGSDGFGEIAAAGGPLGRFPGSEVMPLLRAHLQGALL